MYIIRVSSGRSGRRQAARTPSRARAKRLSPAIGCWAWPSRRETSRLATKVVDSAARHRAGQAGLVLLTVEAAALGEALKWEPSRRGLFFPHLYGDLPLSAVSRVDDLPLGADGRHVFPRLS